ncbi:aminotransferase class I/II-fold pyridoxal phosphate-dependent enzyme [Bacillus pinisoli]|uniref:aminotransferase class I/II-fold pyridoxal phosphate-dependent enzyme n=1 Tax=Bacillus pinisoli TaxID=2901866 RepID=UPI001FF63475|nr:aminotransferase class I/II-fold pyridoxal phosphate-dependent enzyme [Bacillus pinisoli]
MSLFDKCQEVTRKSTELMDSGLYPYFKRIEGNDGPVVQMEGRPVIMAGSNNYLGLSADPRVKEAAKHAISKYGTTNSGSRFMNGTLDLHEELEYQLASFLNKEACITLTTGFQTNQGAIVPLIGKNDFIISDKDNHNSIVQGTLITKGLIGKDKVFRFKHNDMKHLESILKRLPMEAGKLIVVDGVFSMSGAITDLPVIRELAERFNAHIMVDDAHSTGVLGVGGRGTESHFQLDDSVDLITGTFSKSLASIGGFIAGKREVIEYIKHSSPAFIFSASISPAQAAAALKALEIIKTEPYLIDRVHQNSFKLREGLKRLGFHVLNGQTPIIPVVVGDFTQTMVLWKTLMELGIFTNAIIPPAVPYGMEMLRVSVMASHEDIHIEQILAGFEKASKQLSLQV